MPDPRSHTPPLIVVKGGKTPDSAVGRGRHAQRRMLSAVREIDWSILMARAQDGDDEAYRRLLEEITPYLRSLAAGRHRDPSEAEDAVQDILLAIHAIRQTYDPARPFRPWLVAIANRRLVDRFRRRGRQRSHETALTAEHETYPAWQANIEEEVTDRHDLETAVEKLSAGERQAIRLLKLKEMSLKEAAAVSGISIAALKVATHRAVKHLRKILSRSDGT
jgi:RNA polymerase sigma-70 factor (ECF subfamily)